MRAFEFINEAKEGGIGKRRQAATRGLNTFSDGEKWNTDYTLNRVMMAAACTDGTFVPDIDAKSWFGKSKTAHPYTKEEQDSFMREIKNLIAKIWFSNHDATSTLKNIG